MNWTENPRTRYLIYWGLLAWMMLMTLLFLNTGGCTGQFPWGSADGPSTTTGVILDHLSAADEAGWGGVVQWAAGLVGAGGLVAAGRKMLKDRRVKMGLRRDNAEQDTALYELVAGIQEILDGCRKHGQFGAKAKHIAVLQRNQKTPRTEQIVGQIKTILNAKNGEAVPCDNPPNSD